MLNKKDKLINLKNFSPNKRNLKKIDNLDDFFPELEQLGLYTIPFILPFFGALVCTIILGKWKQNVKPPTGPVVLDNIKDDDEFRKVMQKSCEYVIHRMWETEGKNKEDFLVKLGDDYLRVLLNKYMFMRRKELRHFYFLYRKEYPDVFDIPIQFKKIYSKENDCWEEWYPITFTKTDPPKKDLI